MYTITDIRAKIFLYIDTKTKPRPHYQTRINPKLSNILQKRIH